MEEVADGVAPYLGDIRAEWHWVRPAIEELLNDNPDVDAIPEDVYAACKSGGAHLWVVPEGMLITKFAHGLYGGERTLDIWFAWTRQRGGKVGVGVHKFLEPFAKSHGCAAIEFGTRYQPLIDYLCEDLGYRVSTQILRKDLE